MLRYIFLALTLYFLYRFVFHFLIPVLRVSSKMKQQVRDFQDRMQQQQQQPDAYGQQAREESSPKKEGDYIDFEEVK